MTPIVNKTVNMTPTINGALLFELTLLNLNPANDKVIANISLTQKKNTKAYCR